MKIGAAVAGLLAFAFFGVIAFAVLSLRSNPDSPGASGGAWVVVGAVVIVVALLAAVAGAALVALAGWAFRRFRG